MVTASLVAERQVHRELRHSIGFVQIHVGALTMMEATTGIEPV
jgi:hypothetical protein